MEETNEKKEREYNFKPGVSGNPKGRPKGALSIVAELRKRLADYPMGEHGIRGARTYLEVLTDRIMQKAVDEGDTSIMKDLIDRIDGKPQQNVDVTTQGQPIIQISEDIAKRYVAPQNPEVSSPESESV